MTVLNLIPYGDEVLHSEAEEIESVSDSLLRSAEQMLNLMYLENGIGLAATQVGIPKRFFVWDLGEGPDVLFNPRIVDTRGKHTQEEGCLSIPGVFRDITRAESVVVEGLTKRSHLCEIHATGLMAKLFQHEIDHLDGKLYIDLLNREQKRSVLQEMKRVKKQ